MMKRMRPSPRVLTIRMVSDTSVINECSIIKQLTHASFRKNFLQCGDTPEDPASILPVTNGGGSGGDDNQDEVMADVEHQKTPDGRRNVTGADDKEDAAVSTGANDKNGE